MLNGFDNDRVKNFIKWSHDPELRLGYFSLVCFSTVQNVDILVGVKIIMGEANCTTC